MSEQSLIPSMMAAAGSQGIIDAINKVEQAIRDILSQTKIDNETPTGTINGTNTAFVLSNSPDPSASLLLFLNGMFMTVGEDYTMSGVNITFLSAPLTGSILRGFYRY